MKKRQSYQDIFLLSDLKNDNQNSFSFLFNTYYKDLVLFCGNYIDDLSTCEDIVQSVFVKLWADRHKLTIETSIKSYLLKAVKNSCFDEYRHKQIVKKHEAQFLEDENYDTENYILYSDLHTHLDKALNKIPAPYREVFELNRFKGVKYKEIAKTLNVSERTVEVRISKALEFLRKYLEEFLLILFFIILC
ncbi:MAG: RNA polymerase sigma-70 factor [Massilibacteroides sp.]|nr:RNA polymerase sigma-70 factor [Massilibacteroides sp.]